MKAYAEEIKQEALRLLRENRGPKDIAKRLNISIGAVEDWANDWRKDGSLKSYKRPGMEFTNRAKEISNGYYKSIRKRYLSMKWIDHLAKRECGFKSPVEAIPYYLDENKTPRVCAYCGRQPSDGKVWGLDRLDSSLGHVPGNLVPCCGFHKEGMQLSCQASKSKYSLFSWMEMNISRYYGRPASTLEVEGRIRLVQELAKKLSQTH
jgi:hypothetical protein